MARPKAAGEIVYLGRVRFTPGLDAAELGDFLRRLAAAGQAEKLRLLQSLLDGAGYEPGQAEPTPGEDEETTALLDGLLGL